MNCPKCRSGVLETVRIVPVDGEIFMHIDALPFPAAFSPYGHEIRAKICSVDECNYASIEVAPDTLSEAKRIIRNELYKNKHLSTSALFSLSYD